MELRFSAYPNRIFKGEVKSISPIVNPEDKTCKVFIDAPNPDENIKPGMHAEVEIVSDIYEKRLLVPQEAILHRGGRKLVFVHEDGLAKWRYVQTGLENEDYAEILPAERQGEGVTEGEQVLIEGHFTLAHDANIKIMETHEEHLDLKAPVVIKQHKHYNILQAIAYRDCEERPKLGVAYWLGDSYFASDGITSARSWKIEEQGNIINFPKCVAKTGKEVIDTAFLQQIKDVIALAGKAIYPLEVRVYAIDLRKALKRCISKNVKISASLQGELIVQSQSGDSQTTIGCYGFQTTDISFSVAFEKRLLLEAVKSFLKDDVISFQMTTDGPSIIGIEGDYQTLIMSLI